MDLRYRARTLLIGVAVVAVITALVSGAWRWSRNLIMVDNRSGFTVRSLSVAVPGSVVTFPAIPPGSKVEMAFSIRGEGQFSVTGCLSDGTTFGGNFGY